VSRIGGLARDAAWLFAGRVAGQGLAVGLTVVLAVRLGLEGLGEYGFVAAVILVANVVTTFGTDMALIRSVAATGRVDRWPAALGVQLTLSALAIGLIWLAAPSVPGRDPAIVAALRISSVSLIPSAAFSVCTAALRGSGRMSWYAGVGVAAAAVPFVGVTAFMAPGAGLVVAATVLLTAQVVVAAVAWVVCASRIPGFRDTPQTSAADILEMARSSWSIGILGLLGVLYQRTAVLVLAVVAGPAATGWFVGASRIVEASKTGHVALFGALYPAMVANRVSSASGSTLDRDIGRIGRMSTVAAGALSAGLAILAPFIVRLLYGPAFGPSAGALAILAISIVPSTIASYRSLALLAEHREALALRALAASLMALIGLLAVLIPIAGWIGACWAVLGAESVLAAGMLIASSRRFSATSRRGAMISLAAHIGIGARELSERP
jgi:O-antigen/teichoic acid export membrane protein